MLIKYLKFGLCNCSENFVVMSKYLACASGMFVDFSDHYCWYPLIMPLHGIKLINALFLSVL